MRHMRIHPRRAIWEGQETGGVTIMVALFLLVLLTISAMAMSKNSLREVIISGTTRQGAEVRTIADTGIEWSMAWMTPSPRPAPAAGTDAEALKALVGPLARDPLRQGLAQAFTRPTGGEMTISGSGTIKEFDLAITAMGQIELMGTQRNVQATPDAFNPATLQLWSIRSNASSDFGGGQVFTHSREAWFTLPPQ